MKKTATYVIDHENKTITITKDYAKRSSVPGSKEFRELAKLHSAFADYDIQRRTATIKADKNNHLDLTIAFMEKHIKKFYNSEEAVREFEEARDYYKGSKGYYGKMKAWFLSKYPNYNDVEFAA